MDWWLVVVIGAGACYLLFRKRTRGAAVAVDGVVISGDGKFRVIVVGVSFRQPAFAEVFSERLARERADAGTVAEGDFVTVEAPATLELEANNPHDANAVKVLVLGRHIGYLSAKLAPAFRRHVQTAGLRGTTFRCLVEVDLPLHASDNYLARLDLPWLDA
jgi:hypothetical protein